MKDKKEIKQNPAGKPTFNVIDLLIIIVVLACVAGVILRYTVLNDKWNSKNDEVYYITFRADSLSYSAYSTLLASSSEQGDNWIYLDDGVTRLGTVSISNSGTLAGVPETLKFRLPDGSEVTASYSESESEDDVTWTLTGKIRCNGSVSQDGGFLLNGKRYIGVNDKLSVYSKYCDFDLTVTGIARSVTADQES